MEEVGMVWISESRRHKEELRISQFKNEKIQRVVHDLQIFFLKCLLFLTCCEFEEKYQDLRTDKQTPLVAAETTSEATMSFSSDLKFPWLQGNPHKMFPLCMQNTVLAYCLKYSWSEVSLISIVIISPKGCMSGVHFDQSLDISLPPPIDFCFQFLKS